MKAIITIIDNDGRIIEKDKVIKPYLEAIDNPENMIPTKTTYFRFGITTCLYNNPIIGKDYT